MVLLSRLLQPNLATETETLAGKQQVTAPFPHCWGPQKIATLHGVTPWPPQPDAISTFQLSASRQHQPPPMSTAWISGWGHKDKALNGVKKFVLSQCNPAAVSPLMSFLGVQSVWCHSRLALPEPSALGRQGLGTALAALGWRCEPHQAKPRAWGLTQCCQAAEVLSKVTFVPRGRNRRAFAAVLPLQSLDTGGAPLPPLSSK